jgi:hypothetical protein
MIANNCVGLTKTLHSSIGIIQIVRNFGVLWNSSESNRNTLESQVVTSNEPHCSFDHISCEDPTISSIYAHKLGFQTHVKALWGTRDPIAEYKLSSSVTGESQVCSPYRSSVVFSFKMSGTHIYSSWITRISRRVCSGVRSAANILRTIIIRANLVAQVNVNVRNMNDLNWRFSTGSRTCRSWFATHGDGISFNVWPLAESKDCKTKQLRRSGADCHDPEVMGKDWTFESDSTGAEKVS